MFCLRKELGIADDKIHGVEVNAVNFGVKDIVRDKRNKKAAEIMKGQYDWEVRNSVLKVSGKLNYMMQHIKC